ncbi:MAG: hypothetical protein NTZ16_12510 [Verrucomicrobia bacterium]|nr:hypothetical protein [Verrucomicrobiota bacterium]
MSEPKSFWELSTGAQFLTTWDDFTKTKKPFQKVSANEFSRPGGIRRWLMFSPHPPLTPVQMVIPV